MGLLCFWFVLARTPVANVELFGCKPVFFRGSNLALGFSSSENFDFGKRRSCLCRRASRSVFAIPNPPARGLPQLAFHATCLHGCCGGDRL